MPDEGRALVVTLGVPPRRALTLTADDVGQVAPVCIARAADLPELTATERIWDTAIVVAASYARLRRDAVALECAGRARRVVIHVSDRPPSWWRLTAPSGVERVEARTAGHGGIRAEMASPWSVPVRAVAAAVGGARRPDPLRPGSGLRVAVAGPLTWSWAVEESSAHLVGVAGSSWDDRASATPAYDVLVRRSAESVGLGFRRPVLDTAVVNPAGFRSDPLDGVATLASIDGGLALASRRGPIRLDRDLLLSAATIRRLRRLDHVDLRNGLAPDEGTPPARVARLLAVLAGLGVPIVTGRLPLDIRDLLHPDLSTELEAASPETLSAAVGREAVAIRQRRAALRTHSVSASWQQVRADLGLPVQEPTVSIVAATRRPDFVPHLLRTVAAQRGVEKEVIVVTHGFDASDRHAPAIDDALVTLIRGADDAALGDLLALGSSIAAGDVIAKMDDDDWYGPHHLEDLLQAMSWSGAALAGAPNDHVYLAGLDVTVTRPRPSSPETDARFLAGPTLMVRRADLRAVGGWRHQPASVDLALVRAVQESGGMVVRIHGLGFVLCRHGRAHTWQARPDDFLAEAAFVADGFAPPPELPATRDALSHYADVRRNAGPNRQPQTRNNDGSASNAATSARNCDPT